MKRTHMTSHIMQVLKTDEILKTDHCDICMEDFTINGLKFCGNSVKDGKTECKYKMCEKCLIELKRKLRSKCPQCRNKILVKIILENIYAILYIKTKFNQ